MFKLFWCHYLDRITLEYYTESCATHLCRSKIKCATLWHATAFISSHVVCDRCVVVCHQSVCSILSELNRLIDWLIDYGLPHAPTSTGFCGIFHWTKTPPMTSLAFETADGYVLQIVAECSSVPSITPSADDTTERVMLMKKRLIRIIPRVTARNITSVHRCLDSITYLL